ncbi:hypothetical protein [Flagellimonas meridianipacifica]|uniref:Uncharacterized protein n=1 Tax=Flagellimonas meridianipacifica TaxID=1080225 RepID=A0A2T0MHA0_9FLAO|nr:hypothetical protein [Allomuricauda pacifica]PRX56959.1 hypothetical protein CLV81_0960 [Allomuricauda pacifica]
MKWIKTIEDLTEFMFQNKERSSNRNKKGNGEIPRELYLRTCSEIANRLSESGFKYAKSQQKLKLESSDKKYLLTIRFSSNRDNVKGQYVELNCHYFVASKDLEKFSKSKPLIGFSSSTLIDSDIGTLIDPKKGQIIWNLADNKDYQDAITTIPKMVREKLIKIFNDLQSSELVINEIKNGDFELRNPINTVQYVLSCEKKDIADKYLSEFVQRPPKKILTDYLKYKEELKKNGLPNEFVSGIGYGYEIALMEIIYELKITVPNNL